MEAAVEASGERAAFTTLLKTLESAKIGAELDKACADMQALIATKCQPSAEAVARLQEELGDAKVVIARSSANVEDLAGLSGAGLYESMPNLDAAAAPALARGISYVWASLFSRRAVLSRRTAGISQADASMAVLVQVCLCVVGCSSFCENGARTCHSTPTPHIVIAGLNVQNKEDLLPIWLCWWTVSGVTGE
jgi:phosphoglucan,water dikinase